MGTFLFYIFQSTLCLFLLYGLFRLFFRADTLFRVNRILLVAGSAGCMLLPLFQLTTGEDYLLQQPISTVRHLLLTEAEEDEVAGLSVESRFSVDDGESAVLRPQHSSGSLLAGEALPAIAYLVGAAGTLLFFLLSTWRMWQLIHRYPSKRYGEYRLVVSSVEIPSFSWGRTIVLSQADYKASAEAVLLHEQAHLRCGHTLDLLWMELLIVLHWFNPAAWLLLRELREIHEYEADSGVLAHGIDATQYQLLLVRKSVGTRLYSMASGLRHSKLKNRITMMLKKKTSDWARLKLLLFVPVAAGTLIAFAQPEVKQTVEQVVKPDRTQQLAGTSPAYDWELLEQFFERKRRDAWSNMPRSTKKEDPCLLLVNLNNRVMLGNVASAHTEEAATGRWKAEAAFIRTHLAELLRREYRCARQENRPFGLELKVRYDRGAQAGAMRLYLSTVRDVYLELREEISAEQGGLGEAELDKLLPIIVSFSEPRSLQPMAVEADQQPLPMEFCLLSDDGLQKKELKRISLKELEVEIAAFKQLVGDSFVVNMKVLDPDLQMGIVNEVKNVLRKASALRLNNVSPNSCIEEAGV